jgi:hypothetical protein
MYGRKEADQKMVLKQEVANAWSEGDKKSTGIE